MRGAAAVCFVTSAQKGTGGTGAQGLPGLRDTVLASRRVEGYAHYAGKHAKEESSIEYPVLGDFCNFYGDKRGDITPVDKGVEIVQNHVGERMRAVAARLFFL